MIIVSANSNIFEWERADYDALVAYISPRRLLVNGQGLVIAELYNFGQDGNIDQNQLVSCCYMRYLDVLNMKTYIPNLRERLIPSRTVQYLEEDGRAARVQDDASTERSAKKALEKEVSDLKAAKTADEILYTNKIVTLQEELERVKDQLQRVRNASETQAIETAVLKAKLEARDSNDYTSHDDYELQREMELWSDV